MEHSAKVVIDPAVIGSREDCYYAWVRLVLCVPVLALEALREDFVGADYGFQVVGVDECVSQVFSEEN